MKGAHPLHPPRVAALSPWPQACGSPQATWRPHPLPRGLRAPAAVCVHSVTWAASGESGRHASLHSREVPAPSPAAQRAEAVGTLMFQQMATDGQSYTSLGVTEAEGGRLTGRVLGPTEPRLSRWKGLCLSTAQLNGGLCVYSSAPLEGPVPDRGLCVHSSGLMEGALCPQLSTDGEGSVSLADSQRLTPCAPPPCLFLPSGPSWWLLPRQKKPPLTLPGTVSSRLLCLNLKSACSVFRPT